MTFPVLQAAGLVAVALEVPMPAAHVVLACLAATVTASGVPSPGGIGSVDAALVVALVVALVAIGAPTAAAAPAALAYRVLTVWLPLLPGALVLGVLVSRRIV